jgi:hypothetical protein
MLFNTSTHTNTIYPGLHPSTTAASLLLLAKFHQNKKNKKKIKKKYNEVILEGFNHTQS